MKVLLLDEVMRRYQKFTEDPKEEISGNQGFRAHATMLQEVGILPTLLYFHPKGLILGKMWCRGPKAMFGWFYELFKAAFMAYL